MDKLKKEILEEFNEKFGGFVLDKGLNKVQGVVSGLGIQEWLDHTIDRVREDGHPKYKIRAADNIYQVFDADDENYSNLLLQGTLESVNAWISLREKGYDL